MLAFQSWDKNVALMHQTTSQPKHKKRESGDKTYIHTKSSEEV